MLQRLCLLGLLLAGLSACSDSPRPGSGVPEPGVGEPYVPAAVDDAGALADSPRPGSGVPEPGMGEPYVPAAGDDAGAWAPGSSLSPSAASSKAELLLTAPTQDVVQLAAQDHQLTLEEKALVALYWSFLANAEETGEFDDTYVVSGIHEAALALAAKYPHFFRQDSTGVILQALKPGELIVCTTDCRIDAQTVIENLKSSAKTVKALAGLGKIKQAFDLGKAALKLDKLQMALQKLVSDPALDVAGTLDTVASIVLTGAAVVATGEAAASVAAVAALYSAVKAVDSWAQVVGLYDTCVNYKRYNCCQKDADCSYPPPTSCDPADPRQLVDRYPGTCHEGVCNYPKLLRPCGQGSRCSGNESAGACYPCSSQGLTDCGANADCADLTNDPSNCGRCGYSCTNGGSAAQQICSNGRCLGACNNMYDGMPSPTLYNPDTHHCISCGIWTSVTVNYVECCGVGTYDTTSAMCKNCSENSFVLSLDSKNECCAEVLVDPQLDACIVCGGHGYGVALALAAGAHCP